MGGKESKPTFITYEDAVKRVTDSEIKRLKDAFKRSSTLGGYMTLNVFVKEVLGDAVPVHLAEQMFTAFGGSQKGIAWRDLLGGLVLLTRGRQEEKVKFLFGLYANEALTHVQKQEMDSLVLSAEGAAPQALGDLFRESDRVSYEHFRLWVLSHNEATTIVKWLLKEPCTVTLSNDLETPTFYQTLAGVTHLEETDIIELEKRYWMLKAQSKSGRFDLETFRPIVCPPVPESLCEDLFTAFDENRDNHIDFKEMACGISACCRGPLMERQKFCFKVFDGDHDSLLSHNELQQMVEAMVQVRNQQCHGQEQIEKESIDDIVNNILKEHDSDQDGCITQEEYLVWTVDNPMPAEFLDLLFQVCHVVLGLKPLNKTEEGHVIIEWLEREEQRGLQPGQTMYLVCISWWRQWLEYVNYMDWSQGDQGQQELRKSTMSALCPTLTRRSSLHCEGKQQYAVEYSTLPNPKTPSVNGSPAKYATVPRSIGGTRTVGRSQEILINMRPNGREGTPPANGSYNSTPSSSQTSTPTPSPRLPKKSLPGAGQKPGAIDNTPLISSNTSKVSTLTNEGGRLKRDKMLARGRDFELLPDPVWRALSAWYGGSPSLPRTVIVPGNSSTPELELYPITVRLLRHQQPSQRPQQATTLTGMMGGLGGMVANTAGFGGQPSTPRRYLAYTAAFSRKHTLLQVYEFLTGRLRISREDMRLWKVKDEGNMDVLEEDEKNMEQLLIEDNMQLLIEVRNKDLTWPEELSQLAKNKAAVEKTQQGSTEHGATGLNNLGNTCFMNSALQCVSNTRILTYYFTGGMHLYELNRANPLGMKGHIAQRYGELVKDLWSGTNKSIAPLKLRWTIGKYAPRFNGFQQHDSQELLAFLLDGLHEDLNRVHNKPYVELKDSDGRDDNIVAREAWDNHLIRNRSIVVDLFHGQLKSCVRCIECGHTSVRFDPFNYLSLPLPMESCIHIEIIVVWMEGSMPTKYGLRLNMDEKYRGLKKQLSELTLIPVTQILLVEISGAFIKTLEVVSRYRDPQLQVTGKLCDLQNSFPVDHQKMKMHLGGTLYAYEMPPVAPIPTMTAEEERGISKPCSLKQIQRMHSKLQAVSDTLPAVNGTSVSNSPSHTPTINGHSTCSSLSPSPIHTVNSVNCNNVNNDSNHQRSGSCISDNSTTSPTETTTAASPAYITAIHRKMIRMDVYFLSSQKTRPSPFGTPLVIPVEDSTTYHDMYRHVWTQVSRLVSPLPPSEAGTPNHAQDCDDSLGYEYPFTLKVVQKDGYTCAWCPWYRFCRGCKLDCTTELFTFSSECVAVDWEPTALHLRYQTSQERVYREHESVEESRRLQTEPIQLDACLQSFTKEEELGEDELYYCSKCKKHRLAAKKLEIWRLPPLLIIHLKRFQFLNGRWVKSQKIVKYPRIDLDLNRYVVPRNCTKIQPANGSTNHDTEIDISIAKNPASETILTNHTPEVDKMPKDKANNSNHILSHSNHLPHSHVPNGNIPGQAIPISSLSKTSQSSGTTQNTTTLENAKPSTHEQDVELDLQTTQDEENYTDVRYNLYAMSCHTGILGGGHYVTYARNPNNKWYLYNDSSCKELAEDQIDTKSSYILFYERKELDYGQFMPEVEGKTPDTADIDDEFESDLKKMCIIQ